MNYAEELKKLTKAELVHELTMAERLDSVGCSLHAAHSRQCREEFRSRGLDPDAGSKPKPKPRRNKPVFCCLQCGRKFYSTAAAEKAALCGCSRCGASDVDLA